MHLFFLFSQYNTSEFNNFERKLRFYDVVSQGLENQERHARNRELWRGLQLQTPILFLDQINDFSHLFSAGNLFLSIMRTKAFKLLTQLTLISY